MGAVSGAQTSPSSGSALRILLELEGALEIIWFQPVILQKF